MNVNAVLLLQLPRQVLQHFLAPGQQAEGGAPGGVVAGKSSADAGGGTG
jgi:hypothetical protein